ncbi:uncharacterized protein LOC130715585 [Lotus japonicus]|uniref:uncharacterized protein LOC130715585 n=1 Tax=Lotus japonicus TaxID=34305 RepID=UPI0025843174|nr:uncharacterized protein LOC130715585 [Lotus japonicus]
MGFFSLIGNLFASLMQVTSDCEIKPRRRTPTQRQHPSEEKNTNDFKSTFILPAAAQLQRQELNKHTDAETSQSTQNTQMHTSWKDDIFSKVQGLEKRGRVRCMGKMPKCKKSKVSLSKHEELSHRVNYLENLLTSFVSAVQNRLPGEEFNDIARQVADTSRARDHLNSPSSSSNEDSEYDEIIRKRLLCPWRLNMHMILWNL